MTIATPAADAIEESVNRFTASRWRLLLMVYVCPLAILFALEEIVRFSAVGVNLWVIDGAAGEAVLVVYAGLIVASMVTQQHPILHHVGAAFAVVTFLGRAGAFGDRVIDGNSSLRGAVAERLALAVLAVMWHVIMAWYTAEQREIRGSREGASVDSDHPRDHRWRGR